MPGRKASEFVHILIFVHIMTIFVRMLNKTDFVASFAKGLRVLESFDAKRPRLAIVDVARKTGLDRATARRCLLTLHELGYANFDGKFFTLTPRVLRLGTGAFAATPLSRIVQPWLDKLSERIGESVSVSILDGSEIVYLARAAQQRVMSIGLMPGSRLPAHCTSMGRVLLAALPEDEARAIIESSDLTPLTSRSLTRPKEIMDEIARTRLQGYAMIDQEVEIGLRSLAVPVVNSSGLTVASLNTGVAAVQAEPDDMVRLYLSELRKTQQGLRRVLN